MNENQLKNALAETRRKQEITEKAAEEALLAIYKKAKRRREKAERLAMKADETEDEKTGDLLRGDSLLTGCEADGMEEAAQTFEDTYKRIAGKPPKGAQDFQEIDRFAAELYRRRTEANLTQTELAKLAGVTFQTINRLESGRHKATAATKIKIKTALEKAERRRANDPTTNI